MGVWCGISGSVFNIECFIIEIKIINVLQHFALL